MDVQQVDQASFRIVELIEAGATSAEVVFEARQYVDAWRSASSRDGNKQDFTAAIGIFQVNMQSTGDELRKRMPKVRRVERRGVRVVLPGETAPEIGMPLNGVSDKIQSQLLVFSSVVEALASEMLEEDCVSR